MNQMMQIYMKLMQHPETKDLINDPTFMPILQSMMTNPAEAMKHMSDPRVQKVFKVLQEGMSPDDLEKAAHKFNKGGSKPQHFSEEKKEESAAPPPPPPPPKEENE